MGKSNEEKTGASPKFYKGLEQYEAPELVESWAEDEFPDRKSLASGVDRRDVLKMIGGAALTAALTGCRFQAPRKIVPFVQQPEGAIAGTRKHYATCAFKDGYALAVVADQVDGRPVRIDGNPLHPSTMGGLDSQTMAEILNLYDPDRLQSPRHLNSPISWIDSILKIEEALNQAGNGAGIAVLSETVNSPTLARLGAEMKKKYPGMRWFQYEPAHRDNQREGSMLATGSDQISVYNFGEADVIVSIDADPVMRGPASLNYARQIGSRRIPDANGNGMSRIYAFESHPNAFGITADHRRRIKPSQTLALVQAIASQLGFGGSAAVPQGVDAKAVETAVKDLRANMGRGVLIAGAHLPPQVHAAVMALNSAMGSVGIGKPVEYRANPNPMPTNHAKDLESLVTSMTSGQVSILLILGGNPVYKAPADLKFAEALGKVPLKVHLAMHDDETGYLCDYQLPMSHFLEAWGDGKSYFGSTVIGQPLVDPLYDTKSAIEFLAAINGNPSDARSLVRATYTMSSPNGNWKSLLAKGFYESISQVFELSSRTASEGAVNVSVLNSLAPISAQGMELLVLPDPTIHDGRHSNNMWLQETPKVITNLTWDNALLVSLATAEKLGVKAPYDKRLLGVPYYGKADMVTVSVNGASLEVPVWVNLGQADDVLVLHMGYGRTRAGDFGTKKGEKAGGGFNANLLRTAANPTWMSGVEVKKTGNEYVLANVQHHNTIDYKKEDRDREILKETTPALLAAGKPFGEEHGGGHGGGHGEGHGAEDPGFNEFGKGKDISMYPGLDFEKNPEKNYQWAMTIDLSLCTGCNACVTACQAENNIPVVGKPAVQRGREMHWIRVDRYYKGDGHHLDMDNPPIYVQPVTCMHCEQAPCEPVCPVAATVHSHEGLNQMVYNRCVGTRYCSNNCPYKVRRYNFFHFSQRADNVPVLKMLQNPDVTVRYRGVMEKCTYCVQRINHARVEAKREDREIRDGEIKTACQVACPSGAIVFGDMRKKENAVAQTREDARNYMMLEELNTRPRTSYLSRIRNPHPEMEA
ncbi:MAG: TAT-variant-translocated molybdopterin oxidoreductase [Fimbriimonadaceae bacterium]|nr:MAG: TAT-variant-translocated molybdopterin oxidoreductase [Fimbriimonadaceae bacterium]